MPFEWDDEKRLGNLAKHGFDFKRAVELFDGRTVLEVQSNYPLETRFQTTGMLDEVFVTAIWTWRGDVIRIISVRRARDGEEREYNSHNAGGSEETPGPG